MEKVRTGIIGLGNIGMSHYRSIADGLCPELEVTAVSTRDAGKFAALPDGVRKFTAAEEMLDSGLIDAAIIAVPHYQHPSYAIECFKRNIHVMCEKPAGAYTMQVREMIDAADKSKSVFGIMFNQRTDSLYRTLKGLIDSGEYGALRRTNWIVTSWYRPQAYFDSCGWRATWAGEGGGVLINQCAHQLDLWQWICGMPCEVSAKILYGKWHDIETEDDVSAFVRYENGASGVFVASTGEACGTNRLEIVTDRARFTAENGRLTVYETKMNEQDFSRDCKEPSGRPEVSEREITISGGRGGRPEMLNNFAAAILRGEPLIAEGREGLDSLSLSNAMYLSDWLGRPVSFPIDDYLFYTELMKRAGGKQ